MTVPNHASPSISGSSATRTAVLSAIGLTVTFAPASPAYAQAPWADVDAVFAEYDASNAPGCALGVVRDGRLDYGRGYGMANLDHGIANAVQTVFRTGSIGKQFTAAAIAIADQEGVLSLDDPVRRWIPELPRYPVEPTIRHVVHHTSGLRDYLVLMSLRGLRNDDWYSNAEVRAVVGRQLELNFEPGSDYLYSNSGYFILGEIIREATGLTLKEYAQEKIFAPLGMTHSHFHDDHNHIVPLRATGYAPTRDGFRISVTTLDMVGDGGVFTSVEDLVHWVDALNNDRLRPGLNSVLESHRPLATGEPNRYAFGQNVGTYRGLRTVSHGGSFVGYRAAITRFPDQDVSIVVNCNRADAAPTELARLVADIVLADDLGPVGAEDGTGPGRSAPRPAPTAVDRVGEYVGTYYSAELGIDYVLEMEDGALRLRAGNGIDSPVRQLGNDHLVAGSIELRAQREGGRVAGFEVDAGRVRNLRFRRTAG